MRADGSDVLGSAKRTDRERATVRDIDFHALFGALPSPYMILDRDLSYVEVNAAYCRAVERSRDELLGRRLFDLFPNPGEGGRLLRASFERVLATGEPDSIAYIPYAIPRPDNRGGGFEMRYWSAVHTPLRGADGEVAFIVQNTVDVTELQKLKDLAFGGGPSPGETQLIQRAEELQKTNQFLQRQSTHLRDLFLQAPGFMAVLSGPDLTFELVNQAYLKVVGHRPVVGRPLLEALPELAEQGFAALLATVMATREPFVGRAMSVQIQTTPDGPLEERFLDFVYQPILGADGGAWGVFVEGSDVTDRVRAEAQQRLLLDELNHRVKNSLATVQSIAAQTLRNNPDPATFRTAFEARLLALSATHDLLTASSWRGADLGDVLAVEFRPHGGDRYVFDGPAVALTANEALTLGLLFHELATNAAKYGALATPSGRVRVAWRADRSGSRPQLVLTWIEEGGPPVEVPQRRGFGSRLIERSLQGEIGGQAVLDFRPGGLVCEIRMPLKGAA